MIECRCPACGKQAILPDEDAGRTYKCDCGNVNGVPGTPRDGTAKSGGQGDVRPGAVPAPAASGPKVLYQGGPSQRRNFWGFFWLAALVVVLLFLLIYCGASAKWWLTALVVLLGYGGWLGCKMLELHCIRYTLTTENVTIEQGVFSKSVDNVDLFRAKDVDMTQTPLQRMMGIGDVTILSTDQTSPTAVLRNVRNPREVFEAVRKAAAEADKARGVVQVEQ